MSAWADAIRALDNIDRLVKKATPGPWEFDGCSITNWRKGENTFEMEFVSNAGYDEDYPKSQQLADGAFIAGTRTDVPRLLAVARLVINSECRCTGNGSLCVRCDAIQQLAAEEAPCTTR